MLISFDKTGKNQVKPGQKSMADAPVLSRGYLVKPPRAKPTGVPERCH